jgi:hypothetical protein
MDWRRARLHGRPTTNIRDELTDAKWPARAPGEHHGVVDKRQQWSEWREVTPLFCAGPDGRAWERHTTET